MHGLVGAHRTGKTTLAKAYAELRGIPFVQTQVSQVFEERGLNPRRDYPFDVRLRCQFAILRVHEALYKKAGVQWIADRTPLDFLMYTMADVQRENITPSQIDQFEAYREACFRATNEHFTNLILIQPGIQLVDAPGKAPLNRAYMEHLNTIMLGLLTSEDNKVSHYYIPRAITNLEKRLACVDYAVKKVAQGFKEKVEALREQGQLWH